MLAAAAAGLVFAGPGAAAPLIDPALAASLKVAPAVPLAAILVYAAPPSSANLAGLRRIGVARGIVLRRLPMVLAAIDARQLARLRRDPALVSVFADVPLLPLLD